MAGLTFTQTPGYEFGPNEKVTIAKLNQLGRPVGAVAGEVGPANVAVGGITAANIKLGPHWYAVSAGTAAAYTLDYPAEQEVPLTDGLVVAFKAHATCLAAATLDLDGTGAHQLTRFDGTNVAAGDLLLGQIIECRYSTAGAGTWQVLNQVPVIVTIPPPPTLITNVSGWGGNAARIFARRAGGAPNTQVQLWHDGTVLKHRTTGAVMFAPALGAAICDITVAGLGGLDTGAEASSTWYYIWVVSDGTSQFLVLSLSPGLPAAIGAFNYVGLVGSVYNNSAGNFHPFYQMNRKIWFLDQVIGTGLTGPGPAGGTLVIPANTLPPNVNTAIFKAGRTDATIFIAAFGPDVSGVVVQVGHQSTAPAVNGFMACSTFEIPLNANTSMFWQTGDTGATYRVVACGYTF